MVYNLDKEKHELIWEVQVNNDKSTEARAAAHKQARRKKIKNKNFFNSQITLNCSKN
jgi:hypothetical protein